MQHAVGHSTLVVDDVCLQHEEVPTETCYKAGRPMLSNALTHPVSNSLPSTTSLGKKALQQNARRSKPHLRKCAAVWSINP